MKYSDVKGLSKQNLPSGEEGARLAARIKQYIVYKQKLIRGFLGGFSGCLLALLVFIFIGRGTSLYSDYPAVFWAVCGVLGAALVACAVVVGVNMYTFNRFLKKFD